jgi:hypothetical protein
MSTPEGIVKIAVRKILVTYGAYYHSPVQNGMGSPSLDFVGCYFGRYYAIETKAPGKKPTPRQEFTIQGIRASGGKVFVISGEEGYDELRRWLEQVRDAHA